MLCIQHTAPGPQSNRLHGQMLAPATSQTSSQYGCIERLSCVQTCSLSFVLAQLKLCMLQDLEAGPIKSVHFSKVPKDRPEGTHTPGEDVFSAPDFVVGSRTGSIMAVRSGSFEETSSDVPAHRLLVQVHAVKIRIQ